MVCTLPAVFLAVAAILNLNKLIYFNFYLRAVRDGISDETDEAKLGRRRMLLNLATLLAGAFVIAYPAYYYAEGCNNANYQDKSEFDNYKNEVIDPLVLFCIITYFVLSLLFFVVCVVLVVSLKVFFPEFYLEKRLYLWLAMIILTFPLTLRAALDYSTYANQSFSSKINDDSDDLITYQWVFFVFTQLTPILA